MNIQELIAQKQREMAAKKARPSTLKLQAGNHRYRILPSWKGNGEIQFWHDWAMHFVKTPSSGDKPAAVYVCTEKTFGRPCPVCEFIRTSISAAQDDKTLEMIKKANSAQRYLLNVLHLTGTEPTKPQVLEVGQGVFDDICNLIGEYDDITNLTTGIDLMIKREGTGLDTNYSVMPAAKSNPVDKSVMANITDLSKYVDQENSAGQTKAIAAVHEVVGLIHGESAGVPRLAGQSASRAALNAADIEDAEFTSSSASSVASADDLDELDALLG